MMSVYIYQRTSLRLCIVHWGGSQSFPISCNCFGCNDNIDKVQTAWIEVPVVINCCSFQDHCKKNWAILETKHVWGYTAVWCTLNCHFKWDHCLNALRLQVLKLWCLYALCLLLSRCFLRNSYPVCKTISHFTLSHLVWNKLYCLI